MTAFARGLGRHLPPGVGQLNGDRNTGPVSYALQGSTDRALGLAVPEPHIRIGDAPPADPRSPRLSEERLPAEKAGRDESDASRSFTGPRLRTGTLARSQFGCAVRDSGCGSAEEERAPPWRTIRSRHRTNQASPGTYRIVRLRINMDAHPAAIRSHEAGSGTVLLVVNGRALSRA